MNENYEIANPPDAVGTSVVGDVLADRRIRRARVPPGHPMATETRGFSDPIPSRVSAARGREARRRAGVANKRGRYPEFTEEDQELLAGPEPPGGPGRPERAPVRGRKEGGGARRAPDREPRDHGDPRPRQGDAEDRQRDLASRSLTTVRDRDLSTTGSLSWARFPARRRSTAGTRS